MPTTGFVIGTTQAADALSGTTWTNPANAVVDSDTEATEAIATMNLPAAGSTSTGWLKLGTFGLDALIPVGARIDKVEIQVRWRVNSTGGVANQEMCWAISGTRGTNVHGLATEPTTLTTTLTDVTAERAWTRADLLNAVFGVHVRGRNGNSATDPSYRFAWVKVQVTYTLPATPTYTDLYDDFNRADGAVYAGVGATLWETNRIDGATLTNSRVISNRLGLSVAAYEHTVSKQIMGLSGDYDLIFDCVATAASPNELTIWFNATNTGALADTLGAYVLVASSSGTSWVIRKYVDGFNVGNIATATAPAIIAGDSIWIAKRGNTYTIYRDRGGTGFFEVFNFTDTANPSGKFAIEMSDTTVRWDNVEGGPFAPPVPDNETVIDDFNRANGAVEVGAGASIWNAGVDVWGNAATARPVIVSNQLAAQAAYGNIWSKLTLDRDFDLVFDYVVSPTNPAHFWAYLCVAGGGSNPTLNAIYLEWGNYVLANNVDNGVTGATLLNVGATPPASGDTIWIKKRGTLITLYRKPSGGNFAPVASFTNSVHDRAGGFAIGISNQTNARIDNLRGGPILVPVETVIDNFNRGSDYSFISDGVGANLWYPYGPAASQAVTAPYIVGNQMAGSTGKNYFSRSKFVMDKDFDLLLDCPVVGTYSDSFIIDFCLAGLGTDQWTGYRVKSGIGTNKWAIEKRYDQGGGTYVQGTLASSTTLPPVASGESLWIRKRGTKIQILRRPTVGVGNWIVAIEVTDATYDRAGPIVVWAFSDNNGRFDNLRGAPVLLTIDVADSVTLSDSSTFDFVVPLNVADTVTLSDAPMIEAFAPPYEANIDNFNRADGKIAAGVGAGIWTGTTIINETTLALQPPIVGNQLAGLGGYPPPNGAHKLILGTNFDLLIDCIVAPGGTLWNNYQIGFHFALNGIDVAANADGFAFLWEGGGSGGYIYDVIDGDTGGAYLQVPSSILGLAVAGDTIWLKKRGSTISIFKRSSGGEFYLMGTVTNAVFNKSGYWSIVPPNLTGGRWDNLRGGPFDIPLIAADSVTLSDSASFDFIVPLDLADTVTLSDDLVLADFSPAVIANCVHWFDAADDASFVYGTGRAVKEWHDKSGTDDFVSQATVAAQPTRTMPEFGRNGLPTVSFDGGDYLQRVAAALGVGAVTVVIAFFESTHKDYAGVYTAYNTGNANDYDSANAFTINTQTGATQFSIDRLGAGASISGAPPPPFAIYSALGRPDKTQQSYKNGTPGSQVTAGAGTFGAANGILLGGRWNGSAFAVGLIGQIAEICVYDRVLVDSERQQLEAYLTTKWLIAGTAHTLNIADNVTVDDSPAFVQDQTIVSADTITLSDVLTRDQDFGVNPADSVTTSDSFTYLFDLGLFPIDNVVLTDNDIWTQTFELLLSASDSVVVTDFDNFVFDYIVSVTDIVALTEFIEITVGLYFMSVVVLSDSIIWEQTTPQVVVTVI